MSSVYSCSKSEYICCDSFAILSEAPDQAVVLRTSLGGWNSICYSITQKAEADGREAKGHATPYPAFLCHPKDAIQPPYCTVFSVFPTLKCLMIYFATSSAALSMFP